MFTCVAATMDVCHKCNTGQRFVDCHVTYILNETVLMIKSRHNFHQVDMKDWKYT